MKLGDIIVIVVIILAAVAYFAFGFGKLPDSEPLITTVTTKPVTGNMTPPTTTTTTTTITNPVLDPEHSITEWTMEDILSEVYIGDIKLLLPCKVSELPEGLEAVKSPYDDASGCVQLNKDSSPVATGYYFIDGEVIYNLTLINNEISTLSIYGINGESTITNLEEKLGAANDKYENENSGYYQYSYIFDDNNYIIFEFSDNVLSTVIICCIK